MIGSTLTRQRIAPVDRSRDRVIALAAIVVAIAFLIAAVGSLSLPVADRRGLWLPIHLALAGGATSAIAGVMPFFVAAFAAARPADARLRMASLGSVAIGAVLVPVGVVAGISLLGVAGGVSYIGGIVGVGIVSVRPLRGALGPSRGLVTEAYVLGLAAVVIGATLSTSYLAGWAPVVENWSRLKPAHAWLNLIGFVSLTIATTLLHFFPTVIGARIVRHWTARWTVTGIGLGAPIVAAGYLLGADLVARAGAVAVAAGAASLVAYMAIVWRTRGRWTTDLDWHRFAIGGVVSAVAWFAVGIAILVGLVLAAGVAPSSWTVDRVAGPLVGGWVGLAIVASATHLVPAVGPGDQAAHARQRQILGTYAGVRLAALNGGILGLSLEAFGALPGIVSIGALLLVAGFVVTTLLLGRAVAIGLRSPKVHSVPPGRAERP